MPRLRLTARCLRRWLRGAIDAARLVGLSADDLDELAWQARRRLDAGEIAEAARLFDLLATLRPTSTLAHLGRGLCLQAAGDLPAAERAFDAALDLEPADPYALANRAEVRLLSQRSDPALADLADALAHAGLPADLRRRIERLRELAGGQEAGGERTSGLQA